MHDVIRLDGMLPELSADAFRSGAAGTFEVMPGGSMAMPAVDCLATLGDTDAQWSLMPIAPKDMVIQRPLGMPFQPDGLPAALDFPRMTVSRVEDCVCVPGGIVLHGRAILQDSFNASWETGQHKGLEKSGKDWVLKAGFADTADQTSSIAGDTLWIDNEHIDWFGHVIADLLSRVWAFDYLRSYLDVETLKVVVSDNAREFVYRLLHAAGIPDDRILRISRPTRFESLIVASKAFQIQEYVAPPAFRLWHRMRQAIGAFTSGPENIYVSRRANPTRSLAEEDAIETVFKQHGFFILYPETTDIYDQMRLFSQAALIAGCSGSNMFNLAFAANARSVLLFVSPLLIHYSEHMFLAQNRSVSVRLVIGHVAPEDLRDHPGTVHCRWHVNAAAAKPVIERWIAEFGLPRRNRGVAQSACA